jgi:hypothetical protein
MVRAERRQSHGALPSTVCVGTFPFVAWPQVGLHSQSTRSHTAYACPSWTSQCPLLAEIQVQNPAHCYIIMQAQLFWNSFRLCWQLVYNHGSTSNGCDVTMKMNQSIRAPRTAHEARPTQPSHEPAIPPGYSISHSISHLISRPCFC